MKQANKEKHKQGGRNTYITKEGEEGMSNLL